MLLFKKVVVRLKNDMLNEATTMHFHGVLQRNTPWMDGAGDISQCPINPGESFTYRRVYMKVMGLSHYNHRLAIIDMSRHVENLSHGDCSAI